MMNKQLAFVKSGLGLALCFLMVGAGVTPPIHASNANVSISQQAKKVTGTVTDAKGEPHILGLIVLLLMYRYMISQVILPVQNSLERVTSRTRLPIKREIRIITIHITAYLVTYGQRPILSRD